MTDGMLSFSAQELREYAQAASNPELGAGAGAGAAAEGGATAAEGMQQMSRQFREKGAEIYLEPAALS